MRLDINGEAVTVTLSRRNLLSLLHKVDQDWSAKTITKDEDPYYLVLQVESDEDHYGSREYPAGSMHSETEQFIGEHDETR